MDRKPSPKKSKAKKATGEDHPPQLSAHDLSLLEDFISRIDIDEIDLATWSSVHSSLDVHLTLFLTKEEALAGGQKVLHYSRSIEKQENKAPREQYRVKSDLLVTWSPRCKSGDKLIFPDKGDEKNKNRGQVTVTVQVK